MKIIYMGTPDFAVAPLRALVEAGHEVLAVVTQPDKRKGRSGQPVFPPVKEYAVSQNIPVLQPVKVREPEYVEKIASYNADIIVVAAFGQILPKSILEAPKYGCINIHASLLPKYRGAAPIQWVILDGEEKTGITIMQMDVGLDTGDMLFKEEVVIENSDTYETLHDKLSAVGASLVVDAVKKIEAGDVQPVKQTDENTCYASMITKEMGRLDFAKTAEELDRQIRAFTPWPGAYTSYNGKTLKIWKAVPVETNASEETGTIVSVQKDSFTVAAGVGMLTVTEVQLEGKKRMAVRDFLLGCRLAPGEKLG